MAGADIGPRIGIDGESEFRKQLNNINTAIRTLGTEMKKVTSDFSENANSQEALTAKNRVLAESLDVQKKKLSEAGKALDQAKEKFGENSNEALKWQQVLNRTQTSINSLEKEIRENDTSLEEMAAGVRDAQTGLKDFNLTSINASLRTLGTELQKVSSEFVENANSQEALIAKNRVLNNTVDEQKRKLSAIGKALDDAKSAYGENSVEVMKWKQEMNQTQTTINNLEREINQNDTALNEMKRGFRDAETGIEKFKNAADGAEESTSGLGNAIAEGFAAGVVISAIQGIADAIVNLVDETAEYRKIMASLEMSSEKAGYSAQQTADTYRQLYGVLGDDQTSATTTANLQALGLSQKQLTDLTNGAIGAWATYGDSIPIDGLAEAINETAKAGTVTGTFADVLNWAGKSEDDFNKKLASCKTESERANLILQELADQGLIKAGEGWQQNNQDIVSVNQASADLQGTMAAFGKIVAPAVATVKNAFNDVLQVILNLVQAFQSGGIEGFAEELENVFTSFSSSFNIESFVAMGGQILDGITQGIQLAAPILLDGLAQIFAQIGENLPQYLSVISDKIQSLGDMLAELAPVFIEKGFQMLSSLVQGITDALPILIAKVPQIITTFANIINDNFPMILLKGVQLLGQFLMGILQAIPTLIANIPQIIQAIISVIFAYNWLNLGRTIITYFKNGIVAMRAAVAKAGKDIFNAVKNALQNLPKNLLNIAKNGVTGFKNALSSGASAARSAAGKIGTAIFNALKSIPSKVISIGKDIVKGLWSGIGNMTDWVINKIKGFGDSVLSGLKKFFKIKSPSRVMRDEIGIYLAQGIGVGFDKEMTSVTRDMQQSLERMLSGTQKITATAQNSFQVGIDYEKLAGIINTKGIYLNGRLVGRELKEMGFVVG